MHPGTSSIRVSGPTSVGRTRAARRPPRPDPSPVSSPFRGRCDVPTGPRTPGGASWTSPHAALRTRPRPGSTRAGTSRRPSAPHAATQWTRRSVSAANAATGSSMAMPPAAPRWSPTSWSVSAASSSAGRMCPRRPAAGRGSRAGRPACGDEPTRDLHDVEQGLHRPGRGGRHRPARLLPARLVPLLVPARRGAAVERHPVAARHRRSCSRPGRTTRRPAASGGTGSARPAWSRGRRAVPSSSSLRRMEEGGRGRACGPAAHGTVRGRPRASAWAARSATGRAPPPAADPRFP